MFQAWKKKKKLLQPNRSVFGFQMLWFDFLKLPFFTYCASKYFIEIIGKVLYRWFSLVFTKGHMWSSVIILLPCTEGFEPKYN